MDLPSQLHLLLVDNKVRLTKTGNIKFSHDTTFNHVYSASSIAEGVPP